MATKNTSSTSSNGSSDLSSDLAIYQTLMARYDLQPEECVFLDDTKANIDGALRAGMQGILVKTQEQAMQELDELLKIN